MKKPALIVLLVGLVLGLSAAEAHSAIHESKGQRVYVPAYTRIYHSARGHTYPLTTTLVVHNTDPDDPITVESADFYDADGKLVYRAIKKPVMLRAFGALDLMVKQDDKAKGIGASFLVVWRANKKVRAPIIECIFIGAIGQQGISFRSTGTVVKELD